MRKLLIAVAAVPFALAACSNDAEAPPAEETSAAAAAVAGASANGTPPGTFEVTATDGTISSTTLRADGTYTDNAADGSVLAEGTFAVVDGKTCFMPTTEGATPMCYTESAPTPDGSFTATGDDGTVVAVKPQAAAPAGEASPAG